MRHLNNLGGFEEILGSEQNYSKRAKPRSPCVSDVETESAFAVGGNAHRTHKLSLRDSFIAEPSLVPDGDALERVSRPSCMKYQHIRLASLRPLSDAPSGLKASPEGLRHHAVGRRLSLADVEIDVLN